MLLKPLSIGVSVRVCVHNVRFELLTLKRLVGAIVAVLVRMGQQAQFPISFLDFALPTRRLYFFQPQNVVKRCGRASAYSDDGRLLLGCVRAAGATVMVGTVLCAAVGMAVGSTGFGGHCCGGRVFGHCDPCGFVGWWCAALFGTGVRCQRLLEYTVQRSGCLKRRRWVTRRGCG